MGKCNLSHDLFRPGLSSMDLRGQKEFLFGLTRKRGTVHSPEVIKRAVKDSFLDFIDTHTNSHGVFICGSRKFIEFVEDNLI